MGTRVTLVALAVVVLLVTNAVAAPVAADPDPAPATGDAAAQGETVTLTVSIVDQLGNSIRDVAINATWAGGYRTVETAGNGKAFVDVPEGADVVLRIEDNRYTRNGPFVVEDVSPADGEGEITVDVALKASLALRVENASGPVGGATVRLLREGDPIAAGTTGPDGRFDSGIVEQGAYVLVVRRSGHFPLRREIDVRGRDDRTVGLEAGTTTVTVRVRDDHFSPPRSVDDASVTLSGIGTQRTVNGVATFSVPVYSEREVTVTKDGYVTARLVAAVEEDARTVNATITRERELVVDPANRRIVVGETVEVSVVNAYGEPVAGAAVRLDGESAGETGENGRLRVRIESGGENELRASAGGITSEPVTVTGIATPTAAASPTPSPTSSPSPTPTESSDGALIDLSAFGPGPLVALLGIALLFGLLLAVRLFR